MAASKENLKSIFQDTANAIKAKTGDNTPIKPIDFADKINNISTGGGEIPSYGIKGVWEWKSDLKPLYSAATEEEVMSKMRYFLLTIISGEDERMILNMIMPAHKVGDQPINMYYTDTMGTFIDGRYTRYKRIEILDDTLHAIVPNNRSSLSISPTEKQDIQDFLSWFKASTIKIK